MTSSRSSMSLADLWKDFFTAETGTNAKSTKLDAFLTEFLIQLKEGSNVNEIINFCPISGIVTLVGCELLCNIHCVTSSSCVHFMQLAKNNVLPHEYLSYKNKSFVENEDNTLIEPSKEDDYLNDIKTNSYSTLKYSTVSNSQSLRKYLLNGSAWKSLVLLQTLGVEGLSCGRQLSSVLIWLFDEVNKTFDNLSVNNPYVPINNNKLPIYQLFSIQFNSSKEKSQYQESDTIRKSFKRHKSKRKQIGASSKKHKKYEQSAVKNQSRESSDSNDEDSDLLQNLQHSFQLKANTEYSEKRKHPKSNERNESSTDGIHQSDKIRVNEKITNYQFSNVVVGVLEELCRVESTSTGGEILHINLQCIDFAIRNLCILHFEKQKYQTNFSTSEQTSLKCGLIRLLIVSLNKVFPYPELVFKIRESGTFEVILKILNNIVDDENFAIRQEEDEISYMKDSAEYLFGVLYVFLNYLHFLSFVKNDCKLTEVMAYLQLILKYHDRSLLQYSFKLLSEICEDDYYDNLMITLIDVLSKTIEELKRSTKMYHEVEETNEMTFHHLNEYGKLFKECDDTNVCCISFLFDILVSSMDVKKNIKKFNISSTLLKCMLKCGTCCCYPADIFLEKSIQMIHSNIRIQKACLLCLEKILYHELSGTFVDENNTACCNVCGVTKKIHERPITEIVWPCLEKYSSLLFTENPSYLFMTMNHLTKVTVNANILMKQRLLFSLWHPLLMKAKDLYLLKNGDKTSYILHSCLAAMSFILNTCELSESYTNDEIMNQMQDFIFLPEFSDQCCSLLEIIITVNISKQRENAKLGCASSFTLLFQCMEFILNKSYKYFEAKIGPEAIVTVIKNKGDSESCENDSSINFKRQFFQTSVDETKSSFNETLINKKNASYNICVDNYIDLLKCLCTYSKTCSNLVLYSPLFRQQLGSFMNSSSFQEMLRLLLYTLTHAAVPNERKLLIRTFEFVFTTLLCVIDKMPSCKESVLKSIKEFMFVNESEKIDLENVKLVCEILLKITTVNFSEEEVMPPLDILEFLSVNDECITSEDEEEHMNPPHRNSDESEPYLTADEGYEADVEVSQTVKPFEKSRSRKPKIKYNIQEIEHSNPKYKRYEKQDKIAHPEIYELVFDILMCMIERILSITGKTIENTEEIVEYCNIVNPCIQTMSNILIHNKNSVQSTMVKKIISPIGKTLLTSSSEILKDLQLSYGNLFYTIASYGISPSELIAYLNLFTHSKLSLKVLLDPLCKLADDVKPNVPDFIMHFPVDSNYDIKDSVLNNPNLNDVTPFQEFINKIQQNHIQKGIVSCLSISSVYFCFEPTNWSLWSHGCGISLWIRIDDGHNKVDRTVIKSSSPSHKANSDVLHLLSIGHESLFIEFWVDTQNGDMNIYLTKPDLEDREVLNQKCISGIIPPHNWNLVSINVEQITEKRSSYIKVSIYVNNLNCQEVFITLDRVVMKKIKPACVLIGQCAKNDITKERDCKGSLYFSTMSVFRAPIINKYNTLYLMANGPNDISFVNCKVGNTFPNIPSIIDGKLSFSSSEWDQIFNDSPLNRQDILENLLLTYSCENHLSANLYSQSFNTQGFGGKVNGPIRKVNDSRFPMIIPVIFNGPFLISQHCGIVPSIYLIGGPQVLLYLYARVVELDGDSEEQSKALSLLFKFTFADKRLYSAFCKDDTISMLQIIVNSSKCHADIHFLKAMLDAVCDKSIFSIENNCIKLESQSKAVILHPEILCVVINLWRQLNKNSLENKNETKYEVISGTAEESDSCGSSEKSDINLDNRDNLLSTLFYCMSVMIRDDHPSRDFNIYQMNRVNIVEVLLNFCKDRFLNFSLEELSDGASCAFVELIRSLIYSPHEIHYIALLMDFLILMHQASSTYINYARSNFYFLLTDAVQSSGKNNILELPLPFGISKKGKQISVKKLKKYNTEFKENEVAYADSNKSDQSPRTSSINDTLIQESSFSITRSDSSVSSGDTSVLLEKTQKTMTNLEVKKGKKRNSNAKLSSLENIPPENISSKSESTKEKDSNDISGSDQTDSNLTKEYVIIESKDVERQPIQNDTIILIPTPVFFNNLRSDSSRSWTICEGLLLLLKDIISIMPDTYLQQILGIVLQGDMLLMLGNHKESSVRTGVVKVIGALVDRLKNDQLKQLHQKHFFYHLANQISQYPASYDLVTACTTLATGCRASLEDQIQDETWNENTEHLIIKSPPLIAILTCIMYDTSLVHNVVILFKRIIHKATNKEIGDIGMVETVIKCITILNKMYETTSESFHSILEDMESILVMISIKTIIFQHGQQLRNDLNNYVLFMEYKHFMNFHEDKFKNATVTTFRDVQCKILESELYFLESKLQNLDMEVKTLNASVSWSSRRGSLNFLSDSFSTMTKYLTKQKSLLRKLTYGDLMARYNNLLIKITKFLMTHEYEAEFSTREVNLCTQVFSTFVQFLSYNNQGLKRGWWNGVGKVDFQSLCIQLFNWTITPLSSFRALTKSTINIVQSAPSSVKKLLTPNDPRDQRKMAIYLISAEKLFDDPLQKAFIKQWSSSMQPYDKKESSESLHEELNYLITIEIKKQWKIRTVNYPSIEKTLFSKNELANALTDSAMSITRQVVDIQNVERKQFMENLRKQQSIHVISSQKWQKLIDNFTHEKGIWHIPENNPISWELDSTEGPARIRIRLKRCHLNIKKHFIQKNSPKYNTKETELSYLSYLFNWSQSNNQGSLLERLHLNDRIIYMTKAFYVTVKYEQEGELLLTDQCIHFLSDHCEEGGEKNSIAGIYYWPLDSITGITTRRWQLQERAVEIFLSSGHAHLVFFQDLNEMQSFLNALDNCYLPNRLENPDFSEVLNIWRNGSITNWEYLMYLNGLAGRTYNDLMQYPVFPFILSDYVSENLNLNDPSSFRNFEKPMAVQKKINEMHYIKNYNEFLENMRMSIQSMNDINEEPYHYSSLYSNSGTVLYFLLRIPPFTKLFLSYQDDSFDLPDRTFHSIQTAWKLSSCDSLSDVKELIPEFFYLPHFLRNSEDLEFGIRQCGEAVNDVMLPPWSANARLFILIHRQALESLYVRENLPHWIDLVFGYKQTGQAAIDAINVFHPTTYYGFDLNLIKDEKRRKACEDQIRTYGQTPRQLLKFPHPRCIIDIKHKPQNMIEVLTSVTGLLWGNFCGSPQETDPIVISTQKYSSPIVNFVQLYNNEVIGVPTFTTVMVAYINNKGSLFNMNNTIGTIGLITWEHPDNILRLKQKKDVPPEALIQLNAIDKLCVVAHGLGNIQSGLWLGLQSGRICVLTSAPLNSTPPMLNFSRRLVYLYGHSAPITAISVSDPFGVAVTADSSSQVIIWDVHDLTYVRCLPHQKGLITNISISNTLCDIAIVYQSTVTKKTSTSNSHEQDTSEDLPTLNQSNDVKIVSILKVYTVNGEPVGDVKIKDKITCICYSNAPEGRSVNVIAVGLHSGKIKLYSSWNLMFVRTLTRADSMSPLLSIMYSYDSHILYASDANGYVYTWRNENSSVKSSFRMINSLSII